MAKPDTATSIWKVLPLRWLEPPFVRKTLTCSQIPTSDSSSWLPKAIVQSIITIVNHIIQVWVGHMEPEIKEPAEPQKCKMM